MSTEARDNIPFPVSLPDLMKSTLPSTTIYNLLLLDESGSMEIVREVTLRGVNELVQTIKGLAQEFSDKRQIVGLTTFNGLGIKDRLFLEDVSALQPLTLADYQPSSLTPLHDAIGHAVSKLRHVLDTTGAANFQVLVTILTDGEENASKEYTRPVIHRLIEELKGQGWTFTYIGTSHDVDRAADGLNIDNKLAFTQNEEEMTTMFSKEKAARRRYNLKPQTDLSDGRPKADYFEEDEPAR